MSPVRLQKLIQILKAQTASDGTIPQRKLNKFLTKPHHT